VDVDVDVDVDIDIDVRVERNEKWIWVLHDWIFESNRGGTRKSAGYWLFGWTRATFQSKVICNSEFTIENRCQISVGNLKVRYLAWWRNATMRSFEIDKEVQSQYWDWSPSPCLILPIIWHFTFRMNISSFPILTHFILQECTKFPAPRKAETRKIWL
jgi:hypothetical protein